MIDMRDTNSVLVSDLATLARIQQRTLGQDPDHPLIAELQRFLPDEAAIWHTLVYMAFMSITSGHTFFARYPHPDWPRISTAPVEFLKLPTGFERRGLRTASAMEEHFASMLALRKVHGTFRAWLEYGFGDDKHQNWSKLQDNLRLVYGNGRWAAYNTGELLMNVNSFSVLPGDMGMDGSTGPRWGLEMIFGKQSGKGALQFLNQAAVVLLAELNGKYDAGLRIDELETVLCDFHSMYNGDHYIGHYPDLLMDQLAKAERAGYDMSTLWAVRPKVLPDWLLGEKHDWFGARKDLLRAYRDRGAVEWWRLYDHYPRPEGV